MTLGLELYPTIGLEEEEEVVHLLPYPTQVAPREGYLVLLS